MHCRLPSYFLMSCQYQREAASHDTGLSERPRPMHGEFLPVARQSVLQFKFISLVVNSNGSKAGFEFENYQKET